MIRDKDKFHVPDWPKHEATYPKYRRACVAEQHSHQSFVWIAKDVDHFATVAYDLNGMAIGYTDLGKYYLFD